MAQIFRIHPVNPQPRLIKQVVGLLCEGKVIIYPTDSCYALGCQIGHKAAQERIRRIREVNLRRHNFTLVCRDLSELAIYSIVDNPAYRLIKTLTPGPYTFILKATREVPRRLQDPRRKTIGLRVPDNRIALTILEALGEPIMSSTLLLPGEGAVPTDPEFIYERFGKQVDLVIDGGNCGFEPTTVVDFTEGVPQVIRQGKGDISLFEQ